MHVFHKTCQCQSHRIPLRSNADFDAHAVEAVFCPTCVKHAPDTALKIAVLAVPGWTGHYAVQLNHPYLAEVDRGYRATQKYTHQLFEKGKLSFGFLPHMHARRSFVVLGGGK